MFMCQITGKMSKLGEKCFKVVLETRERVYTENIDGVEVEVGRGWEIVKEVSATEAGVNLWTAQQTQVQ